MGPSCCLHPPLWVLANDGGLCNQLSSLYPAWLRDSQPRTCCSLPGPHGPGTAGTQGQPCLLNRINCQDQRGPARQSECPAWPGRSSCVYLPISELSKPLSSRTLPHQTLGPGSDSTAASSCTSVSLGIHPWSG